MSDSQVQESNSTKIPPCPFPLVDILKCLGDAEKDLLPEHIPDSQEAKLALKLIKAAAHDAYYENKPFTIKHAAEFIVTPGAKPAVLEQARVLIDDMDVETYGEIVGLIAWLCERINLLAGIPIIQIHQTIGRLVRGKHLDWQYPEDSLNHVAAKLRELDSDKTTANIWLELWGRSPVFRSVLTESIGPATLPPTAPQKATKDKKKVARDKWIYEQCCKLVPYSTIISKLKKFPPSKGWESIESPQGIRAAAMKYAEDHEKPPIPNRQNK